MPRRHYRGLVCALCAIVGLALDGWRGDVYAQRVFFSVAVPSTGTTSTTLLDLGRGDTLGTTPEFTAQPPVFTFDGRYLLREVDSPSRRLVLRDLVAATELTLPFAFSPRLAHPRTLAVFGLAGGQPARLDTTGLHVWPVCPGGSATVMDLGPAGAELFASCTTAIVVIDSTSGQVLRRLELGIGHSGRIVVSDDGLSIVLTRVLGERFALERISSVAGQVLVQGFLNQFVVGRGPTRDQVVVADCGGSFPFCRATLADFNTLVHIADVIQTADQLVLGVLDAFWTADGRQLFLTGITDPRTSNQQSTVKRIDVASGAVLNTVVVNGSITMAVASLPLPVLSFGATVAAQTVSLTWQLPADSPAATGYRLAIGSQPGASDSGSVRLGPAETFTATGVPAGRYFVRLHAVNHTGEGPASPELVVDVP
jgi:hypothetical protein